MIALLVLLSLSLSIRSQLDSCLTLGEYKENYITNLSDCHEYVVNPDKTVDREGEGGYGKVISCDFKTEKNKFIKIAVKIVELSAVRTIGLEEHKKMIDNELITLHNINQLENAWLPLYYGCIYDPNEETVYIFMEHIDAIITDGLKKNTYENLEPKELQVKTLHFMLQITRGVEGLHNIGMAHNDIRNFNIMLDTHSGVVKLIDFGRVCIADLDKYNEAVKSKNLKNGFNTNLKLNKSSSTDICALNHDIENLELIFFLIMKIILNIPKFDRNASSIASDNKQFKKAILSIFKDDGQVKTIASVVCKLTEMLGERADFELLKLDELSKNYHRENAEKFELNLFQPKSNSKENYEDKVDSYEALNDMVIWPENTNIWTKTTNNRQIRKNKTRKRNVKGCGVGCAVFRSY